MGLGRRLRHTDNQASFLVRFAQCATREDQRVRGPGANPQRIADAGRKWFGRSAGLPVARLDSAARNHEDIRKKAGFGMSSTQQDFGLAP
jgi:hypothetical protein